MCVCVYYIIMHNVNLIVCMFGNLYFFFILDYRKKKELKDRTCKVSFVRICEL